jgi:SAM-dependent methyltransferase
MTLDRVLAPVHTHYVHSRRVRVLADMLAPLLPKGGRVLDVGCGDGRLTRAIADRRPDLDMSGVDILVRADTAVPVSAFDGETLLFADGTFDAVLCVDVLHHTVDPRLLLAELARVGRQVVLKDHTRDGFLAGATLRTMDWVGNARHGVALPYTYFTRHDWENAFTSLSLTVERFQPKVPLYFPPVSWVCGRRLHFIAVLRSAA